MTFCESIKITRYVKILISAQFALALNVFASVGFIFSRECLSATWQRPFTERHDGNTRAAHRIAEIKPSANVTGTIFATDTKKVIFLTFEVAMKEKSSSGRV